MADKGLRNPLRQAADDIQRQAIQIPEYEPPARQGLGGRSSSGGDYDFTPTGNLLPPPELEPAFISTAERYGVPANVLMALAQQESNYNPNAIGVPTEWGRARGMLQYIDPTAESMGIDPMDPIQSLDAAAKQLRQRLDDGYSMEEAVKAHFAGDDRKLWGPKTERYGREVLGKAGAIYDLAAPREDRQPENPRAFGESGIPFAPEQDRQPEGSGIPDQSGPVDAMTGAQRQQEQDSRLVGGGEAHRQQMREQQAAEQGGEPQVDAMTGAARRIDGFERAAREEAARRGKATVLTDFGNLLQIGHDRGVLAFREGVRQVFGDKTVEAIDSVDEWMNGKSSEEMFEQQLEVNEGQLSQEMFDARRKDWITEEEGEYGFGPAWGDWRSYAAGMVESLPETAVTMLPGAILAKGVYANGLARGLSASQAGRRAATTATIAGSLTEGFMGGGHSAREVREAILKMPEDALSESTIMQHMMSDGMSFEEARAELADSASTKAFALAGAATGVFGGQADRVLAKLLTQGSKNRFTAAFRGAIGEGLLEEAPQEGAQQTAENLAMQDADPNVDAFQGVPNAMAGGAVAGAGMGAGMGALAGGKRNTPAEVLASALNREIDNAQAAGMEGEALLSLDPSGRGSGPDTNPDPNVYENAWYTRQQWEQDWAEFDRQNPDATINGSVGDINQPAPGGAFEAGVQDAERSARLDATEGERVVVRSPTGEVTGEVQRYREDGNGGFEARILGDDGVPYVFNDQDGVKIVRESDAGAAPGAQQQPQEAPQAQPQAEPQAEPQASTTASVPTQMTNRMREQLRSMGYADADIRRMRPQEAWDTINSGVAPEPQADTPPSDRIEDLTDEQLDEQRQYVARQARQSGWTSSLNRRRKEIKAELQRREGMASEQATGQQGQEPSLETQAEAAMAASSAAGRHLGTARAKQSPEAAREIAWSAKDEVYGSEFDPDKAAQVEQALSGNGLEQPFPSITIDDEPRFGASGGYKKSDNTIHISNNPREWSPVSDSDPTAVTPERTIQHEVGHWGFMTVLSGDQRLEAAGKIAGDLRPELIPGEPGVNYPKRKFDDIDEYVAEMYSNHKRGLPTDDRLTEYFEVIDGAINGDPQISQSIARAIEEGEAVRGQRAQRGEKSPTLPRELAGAKPRYNYRDKAFSLTFINDIDRAAYIAAQKSPSKRDADYVAFVRDATGMSEDEVRAHGRKVREAIKAQARDADPGSLIVPSVAREAVVDNAQATSEVVDNESSQASDNDEPIVEHETKRGRTLRGVVRDVSEDEAKSVDPYAFRKNGGWFIREKRLAEAGQSTATEPDVPRESLMFTNSGKPFKSYEQAQRKITNRGLDGKPVQVDDGWGIQLDASVEIAQARENTDTSPTEAQAEAGNYRKGRVNLNGFEIAIENPKGSTRRGRDAEGREWESTMAHDYGDIKGTTAADGDNLDVFLGDQIGDGPVYVVDQVNDDGSFDEHKIMMGFRNKTEARKGYLDNYEDGWQGLGDISELSADDFKAWVNAGDLSKPLSSNAVKRGKDTRSKETARPTKREAADNLRAGIARERERARQAGELQARYITMPADDVVNDYFSTELGSGSSASTGSRRSMTKAGVIRQLKSIAGDANDRVSRYQKALADEGESEIPAQEGGNPVRRDEVPKEARQEESADPSPMPRMEGVKLKRDGSPFASSGVARRAIENRKMKNASVVKVPGGYGIAVAGEADANPVSADELESRRARVGDTPEGIGIEDYSKRSDKELSSLSSSAYSATGFTGYIIPAENAEAAMEVLRSRGAIIDDWRGAGTTDDGILNRPIPEGTSSVARGEGGTIEPGQLLGESPYIETATDEYVAVRSVEGDRLTSLKVEPRVSFERSNGVTVRNGDAPAPVALADEPGGQSDAELPDDGRVGVNRNGKPLYEDENGVRFYYDRNVKLTEPVAIIPGRGARVEIEKRRGSDFEAVEPQAEPNVTTLTEPMRLYHGTAAGNDFDRYDVSRANSGVGSNVRNQGNALYATESERAAQWFSRQAEQGRLLTEATAPLGDISDVQGDVIAFDLAAGSRVLEVDEMPAGKGSGAEEIVSQAREDGYDAIRFPEPGFDTVEGDPEVADMLNGDGRPSTVMILNDDALTRVRDEAPKASANTIFTEDAAEKARALLKSKLGQLNSGIDPEIMQAGITLAGYHIEKGARSFAAYAQAMIGDLGEVARPYLKSWYMGVKYDPRAAAFDGMDDAATVDGYDVDAITTEEQTDERQSDAAGRGEDQGRGGQDSGERGSGRPSQQRAARGDRDSVEDVSPGNVEESATAGDRQSDGGSVAEPNVARDRAPGEGGNAAQRGASDRREGLSDDVARGAREPSAAPRQPDSISPANPGTGNYYYDDPLSAVGGGQVARFKKNQAAIEKYLETRDEDRLPTREEQEVIAGYTGWGSFGQELFQGTWANPMPKSGWEARDRWLRDHLGEDEWKGMQRSIINAHYTDPPTTMAMWSMMDRMGFKGGRVLEPSMGIGNFFGMMPRELASRSQLTGIELDPVTGGMAKQLYPDAGIHVMGYQESKTPDDFYDVVIGNWPFENSPIADRRYNKLNPMVHDYFFLKALDQVRPGGIVMAITSAGSMDKADAKIRREMAKKAELVAAYRLPSGAFQEYAGTKVVTDIMILRKRPKRIENVIDEGWIQSKPMDTKAGTPVKVNEYFHNNPQNVIGEIDFGSGTTYGRAAMIVHAPKDMQAQLDRIVASVPEGAYRESTREDTIKYVTNHTDDREGSLTKTDKGLFVVRGEKLAPANEVAKYRVKSEKTNASRESQLESLIGLRRQYAELIEAERSVDANAEPKRKALKKSYDAYVKQHGPINDSWGINYLKKVKDPFTTSLRALERNDGGKWVPATILSRSTIRTPKRIESPSIEEAYVLSRNGAVNPSLSDIAEVAGKSEEEVRKALIQSGAIFDTPGGDTAPSDVYLSGNVRQKLRDAQAALDAGDTRMKRNVKALKEALPADIPYFNIEVQMGASWVPTGVYEEYVAHMLDLPNTNGIEARYDMGRWKISIGRGLNQREEARTGFGTKAYPFNKLVNAAISNQTVTIKKTIEVDGSKMEVVDREATDETNNKIADMREKFGEWLWADGDRRNDMETEYNEVRNSYASPRYDGSFLRFEGMALEIGNSQFNLRQHQADAIWRGLVTRKSLNAHEVGTGKSFTLAGIAVESRRYGIAKKPLVFAHNANSASVAADINVMYPAAKVLYLDNLKPSEIDTRLRQIANDDWDAVVVPHSLIDRFSFTEETLMSMAQEDIEALEREAYEAAKEDGATLKPEMLEDEKALKALRSPTAKNLVKQRNRIIENIKKQAQKSSRDNAVTFENLGVDMVLVDEVHEFKKPPITTKMRVKGLQTDTSQRSLQLRFITDYIRANNGGANVHTFTGTPITNTLTEIFHQMRYIMKEDMAATGVDQWDGWFGSFAKEVQDVELNGAGDWETVNRLRGFINVPELRKLVGLYMDVVFSEDMPEMQPRKTASGKTLDDPTLTERERAELLNGRTEGATDRPYKQVVTDTADLTDDQKAIFRLAQKRSQDWKRMSGKDRKEAMQNGAPEVPIQVEALVAKASFDARLARDEELAGMEGQVPDEPDSKLSRAINNIVELYNSDPNANQVVFSNTGLGTTATRSVRDDSGNVVRDDDGAIKKRTVKVFSSMRDMIERLVQAGIPREEIALVDGSTDKAKRKEIAEAMNRSEIRVVIGSTQSLGVGVNMQRNLRAMHHMDAPYMPGDLEQRNGRGQRQGNQWNTVKEFRYITDRLDGRRWQILSIKQQFIEDFLKSDGSQRVIEGDAAEEDQSDILSTFAEAAGDPRILVRTKLESQRDQLLKRQRLHEQGIRDAKSAQGAAQRQRDGLQDDLDRWESKGVVEASQEAVKSNAGKSFSIEIDGKTYNDRKEADEALQAYTSAELSPGSDAVKVGSYGGLPITAVWDRHYTRPRLVVDVKGEDFSTGNDSMASLEGSLRGIPAQREAKSDKIVELDRTIERLAAVQQQPFARADKLKSTERQLKALEADLADNPVPPPAWLRQGAPVDTAVKWRGNDYTVTGHRWNENGWFVLSENSKGDEITIPYAEAKDDQGMTIYEERPFEAPELASDIPMDIMRSHKPGMRMITYHPDSGEEVAVEITRAPFREGGKDSPIQVVARFPDGQSRQIEVSQDDVSKALADADGGQSVDELDSALRENRFASRVMDQGRVTLHPSVASTGRNLPASTSGYVDRNGKIHLIASNIAPGTELPTLMHEVFHNTVQPLVGSAEWSRLENDLRALRSRARRARGKFRDVYREAQARVESAKASGDIMTPQRELEEFAAYAVEQYERMPKTLRTWVDNAVGTMKAWLRDKMGIQLGRMDAAQLRAMAVAGLRSRQAPGSSAVGDDVLPLSVSDATPQQKRAALTDAIDALDGKSPTPPSVGRVIGDMSRIAKWFAHPRTIASLHKSFQPVYKTGINQFEMRDAIIDDLYSDYRTYSKLSQAKKEKVNKVLELGRLTATTFSKDELKAGVTKPETIGVVKFNDEGRPYTEQEPLHSELMDDGETVKMTDEEADAYLALREMFDSALSMFRDQTLEDYGLSDFKGVPNAAKAIMDSIDDTMSEAESERRQNVARFINEIEQAKRTGYVPFTRYGDYVIAVKEKLADLGLVKASDPRGGWIVTGKLPERHERFLAEIGAEYDNLEGGWRVDRAQKQALEKENERTVYSTKVETGMRDLWKQGKAMKAEQREDAAGAKLDNIPSVRDAIAKVQDEWVGDNPLRQVRAFPTAKVSGGKTVSLSDLDALAEVSSIDNETWDAVREQLADTIKGQSFRKHFFQAQNVPGYSGDFERSITDYMGGMGGYLSRRHHQRQWEDSIERIKGPRLREYAEKYRDYTNSPQEEFAMLRQVGFLYYIAGNLATAFVNTTQVPVMTMPALSMVAGNARAAKEVARAYKDAIKMYGLPNKTGLQIFDPKKAPADVRAALQDAWGKGAFVPLETFEVMAASRIRHAGQRRARRGFENLVQATAYVFTAAERLNRLVTFMAAARLAKNPKVQNRARRVLNGNYLARQTVLKDWSPENFAEYIIDETQYRMGKANRPTVMRNVGAPVMQFKSFMFQTLETWYRWMSMQGKEGKMSAAASIAMMVGLGGLWGFPGAEDARDLLEALWRKLTKEDVDLESELRVWIYDTTGQRWLAEGVTKGAPYPTGLDMSRVGMGRIMPQGVDGVFGIPFDMFVGRPSRAMTDVTNENYPAAIAEFVPNAVRNVIQAAQWSVDGAYDSRGRKLLDSEHISTAGKIQRAAGFQPSDVSEVRDYEWAQYRDESRIYNLKRLYTDRLGRRIADMVRAEQDGDAEKARRFEEEITEIYMEIAEHNRNASPEDIIEIGQRAINNRVTRELGGVVTTWGDEGRSAARGSAAHLREVYGLDEILNDD